MEALAARQLQRQKAGAQTDGSVPMLVDSGQSAKERLELNRTLGFADPPAQVFALGKDECAAVWWSTIEDETITGWEVHRYRKDKTKPNQDIWHYKGVTAFPHMIKNQTVVNNLANDYEYRFTVKSVNSKGSGVESTPSNPVMVEKPLPMGWFRFLDKATKRHYYANVRLNASSWTRPEQDPWFLDEAILLNFEAREIEALKALYKEEIAHFKCVTVDQFLDVLREIGERCSKGWITQLFRGYAGSDKSLQSWKHFMEVINHIKRYRTGSIATIQNPLSRLMLFLRRKKVGVLLQPKAEKMGDWVIEYSAVAERNFYRNSKTGEACWSMPPQVRFYIPPRLEDKLLLVFDYGDLEEFQQYFSLLDVDNSGDLSGKEIKILLRALDIKVSDVKLNRLLKAVDLNGNGTIEFDEYCWMMLQIFRKDNTGLWKDVRAQSKVIAEAARASAPARQSTDASGEDSVGALGLSGGSLENSLFGDKAWSEKLSYRRVRTALSMMNQFAQSSGKGSFKRRFSFSSGSSFRGNGLFAKAFASSNSHSAGNGAGVRQNSMNSLANGEDSEGDQGQRQGGWASRWLCCACASRHKVRNHSSKLNTVLSKYDEDREVQQDMSDKPGRMGSYYPPASLKVPGGGSSSGGKPTGMSASSAEQASAFGGSAAATNGSVKNSRLSNTSGRVEDVGSPPVTSSPPKAGRRVSFTAAEIPSNLGGGGASLGSPKARGDDGSVASGRISLGAKDSPAGSSNRKRNNSTDSSLQSTAQGSTGKKGVRQEGLATTLTEESSANRRARRTGRKSRRDSAREAVEDADDQEEKSEDEQDNRSVASFGSAMRKMTSFLGGEGGDGDASSGANSHPKHCMCGCRAY